MSHGLLRHVSSRASEVCWRGGVFYFTLGLLLGDSALLASDEPMHEPLTLKGVVALALRNNGEIKSADLAKVIEEERIKSAMLAFDLHVKGEYLYQYINSPQNAQDYVATGGGIASPFNPAKPLLSEPNIFKQRNHITKAGLVQKFDTGTIVELGTSMRVLKNTLNSRRPPAIFTPEWESFTGLTVTQPLMQGWGRAANTAEIRIAKANMRTADLEWQSLTSQVVAEVMKRYYDVIFTLENLKVQREAIELSKKLMEDTRARSEQGQAAANDVRVAEAGVYQRTEDALAAEMQYVERQNALQMLFKSADQVIQEGSRIVPVDKLQTSVPDANRRKMLNTAMAHRPELKQADELIAIKAAELEYAKNQSQPSLDLVASAGLHGLDRDASESYRGATAGQGPEWTAGVQFSMPLNRDHLQARRRGAEDDRTRALIRRGDVRLRVALEVDTVISRLKADQERLIATRKSLEAAEQSAEGGLKRLKEGVATSFEVLQLQKDFSQARSREYAVLADLNKDIVDLYLATGTLLDNQQVTLMSQAATIRQEYGAVPVVRLQENSVEEEESADDAVVRAAGESATSRSVRRPLFSKSKRN